MVSKSKINKKYQVVLPKQIRKLVKDIKPGKDVYITPINDKTLKITIDDGASWVEDSGGIAKGLYGKESIKWLRKLRSEWITN